jgi:hypothetical protein
MLSPAAASLPRVDPVRHSEMEWRPVPGTDAFAVSEYGDVKRIAPGDSNACVVGRWATPKRERYVRVYIANNGQRWCWLVHRLVATVFIGPPPSSKHQAAHKDGNTYNNHYSNLYWATPVENAADRKRHGTQVRGRRAGADVFTDRDVEIVRELSRYRVPHAMIAEIFNTSTSHVGRIISNKIWMS